MVPVKEQGAMRCMLILSCAIKYRKVIGPTALFDAI